MVCLGCLHLAGGPYAMLQGVAWATMLASYSAENGLVQGAIDTFSGERPCQLCKSIADTKAPGTDSTEPLPSPRFTQLKMLQDMVPPRVVSAGVIRGTDLPSVGFVAPIDVHGNGREAPPVPPPLNILTNV
ncbi:MAG: hypothetical protein ACNA8L_08830 [Luteolibacter sp.]